jgi:hypothetical protein
VPADGQAFTDHDATARTGLASIGSRHGDNPLPSICCFGCEDTQELAPARVLDGLGEMMILDHIGRVQVLIIDHIVLSHECEHHLAMEVHALTLYLLMRFGK